MFLNKNNKPVYFNNSSTTEMYKDVKKIISKELNNFYNPSDIFEKGLENHCELEQARAKIAGSLCCIPEEIYFTSCGSEGDSWLIQSLALYARDKSKKEREEYRRKRLRMPPLKNQIITSTIEHKAVLNTCKFLEENMGFEIIYVKPDEYGFISEEDIEEKITPSTALVSIMYVNNILGTIQPIEEISEICAQEDILFHVDGVQALGNIEIDFSWNCSEISAMTFSGHKIHGPKCGFVYINRKIIRDKNFKFNSLIHGGGQENGLRAGTENLPYIKGLAQAVSNATKDISKKQQEIKELTKYLENNIQNVCRKYNVDVFMTNLKYKSPFSINNNVHFCLPDISADVFVDGLSQAGIYVSSGSACNSGNGDPDYVLQEIGIEDKYLYGGIRITVNEFNTIKECERFIYEFEKLVDQYLDFREGPLELEKAAKEMAKLAYESGMSIQNSEESGD